MTAYADAIAVLGAAILFLAGCALLAFIGLLAMRFYRDTQGGRLAKSQADAQDLTVEASQDALDEVAAHRARRFDQGDEIEEPYDPMRAIIAEREVADEGDVTTFGNEEIEEAPPIPPDDGMYAHDREAS